MTREDTCVQIVDGIGYRKVEDDFYLVVNGVDIEVLDEVGFLDSDAENLMLANLKINVAMALFKTTAGE